MPDIGPMGSLAGWFLLAVTLITGFAVVGRLVITGKLIPGPTYDRALKQIDERDRQLAELTPLVREQGRMLTEQGGHVEFMADFMRDLLRERARSGG